MKRKSGNEGRDKVEKEGKWGRRYEREKREEKMWMRRWMREEKGMEGERRS